MGKGVSLRDGNWISVNADVTTTAPADEESAKGMVEDVAVSDSTRNDGARGIFSSFVACLYRLAVGGEGRGGKGYRRLMFRFLDLSGVKISHVESYRICLLLLLKSSGFLYTLS